MNLARLHKGNDVFEVVIDSEKAYALRNGKSVSMRDVLLYDNVFSDAHKGLAASEHRMKECFKTADVDEVARHIIMHGELQLSAAHRAKMRSELRRKVISLIHSAGVDPRTHAPHPESRIESALQEAKVRLDDNKPAEAQLRDVLRKLKPILPLRTELKELQVIIGPREAPRCYNAIKQSGNVLREEWIADGSWLVRLEINAAQEGDFYEQINALTHGAAEIKVVRTK